MSKKMSSVSQDKINRGDTGELAEGDLAVTAVRPTNVTDTVRGTDIFIVAHTTEPPTYRVGQKKPDHF